MVSCGCRGANLHDMQHTPLSEFTSLLIRAGTLLNTQKLHRHLSLNLICLWKMLIGKCPRPDLYTFFLRWFCFLYGKE